MHHVQLGLWNLFRFRDEWLKGHDPKDFYFRLKEKLTVPWVSCTPHKDLSGPDYLHVRESQCQMMAVNLHGSIVSNFSNYYLPVIYFIDVVFRL